jgi:hypothetical protein
MPLAGPTESLRDLSDCLTPRAYRAIHVTRRLCFLIAVAVAAGATAAAAATPVVPVFTQHRIAATVPALAYVPARLAIGWRYERWTHAGPLRIFFVNKAGRDIVFVASKFGGSCRAGMEKSFQLDGVKVWWSHTSDEQQAWRCVNGMRLVAASSLTPHQFADVGLGRIAASGHRIR